jgi:TolB-like protein/Tfp pilus assembly protein PilF
VSPAPEAIAVLPFLNLSPDPDQEYFSDGLTEEIISRLAAIESLRVAARTSSFAFKGLGMDVRRIGAELGVGSILEGSVRRDGDRLRVTAQLIQVGDGFHLWSGNYERELDAVFDIQREIADSIATTLEAELEASPAIPGSAPTTDDLIAYELYLRGRHQWVEFRESSVREAISTFERAIERVPEYAAAWAGLADAYTTLWDHGYDLEHSTYERAEAAARRAVALDDRLADAHAALAYAFNASGQRSEARRAAAQALALRPGWSRAHVEMGQALVGEGSLAEGLEQMQRAAELDPLAAGILRQLGRYLLYSDEMDAALSPLWRSYDLNPHDVLTPIWLWETYRRMGDTDGALEASLLMLPGPARRPVRALTRVVGQQRMLRWVVESALWWEPGSCGRNAYGAAFWLAALDEADRMFACLEEAQRQRFGILTIARIDPIFEPYRADPRFRALTAEGSRGTEHDPVSPTDR